LVLTEKPVLNEILYPEFFTFDFLLHSFWARTGATFGAFLFAERLQK
jgi:hypothetical protein